MKRLATFVAVLTMVSWVGAVPGFAQRGQRGGPVGPRGAPGHVAPGHGPSGMHTDRGMHAGGRSSVPEAGRHASSREAHRMDHSTPVEHLAHNTRLASKLQPLLPAGRNPQEAASGFKNLGQFVAAVHVSRNLNIPFDQLKTKMAGPQSMSLGEAIQQLNPNVNAKAEAKKAMRLAKADIKDSASGKR